MSVTLANVDATWVNPSSVQYDAGELRRADAAMFAFAGIVRTSDTALSVSVNGSDVVTVKAGSWVIPGNAVAGSGVWRGGIASDVSGNLAARDATYGRIDLVVARQLDTDVVASHAAYTGRIEIISGTPSSTPAVPALPSMAVELARITVPASGGAASSVDSSHRTYAATSGGELVVASSSVLPTTAPNAQRAFALDTGTSYRWDGFTWNVTGYTATPELEVRITGTKSLSDATLKTISWDTADTNISNMWSSGGTITINKGGVYTLGCSVQFAGTGNSAAVTCGVQVNGTVLALNSGAGFVWNEGNQKTCTITKRLNAGDTVQFVAGQNSGSAMNIENTGGAATRGWVYWQRA